MVGFVLLLGVMNLALGYGVAIALADPPFLGALQSFRALKAELAKLRASGRKNSSGDKDDSATDGAAPAPQVEEAGINELPRQWLDQLIQEDIHPNSFVEAAAQVLRLDVGRYREQLLMAEWRARQALAAVDAPGLMQLRDDMKVFNTDWLAEQTQAASLLSERRGRLGIYEKTGADLEQVLLDQAAQIKAMCANVDGLDFQLDLQTACKRLLLDHGKLIDLAHTLRDQMHEVLAVILRNEKRLDSIPRNLQTDAATGLLNRTGIEVLFDEWWREEANRGRLVSLVLVDIDRFARLNERLGTRTGDRALHSFGQLLMEFVRRDRGFDRVGRLSGQSFLIFLGDTGPHHATSTIERIRQTLEATTFDYQGSEFELTISSGVVEINRDEQVGDLLKRLTQTAHEAKKGGRNRTAIDEGQGPEPIDPPQYQVKARVISIEGE